MNTALPLAILLKPLVFFVLFVLIVAPITWALYRVIPEGRLRLFLFRDRTSSTARTRDKVLMVAVVLAFYMALLTGVAMYMH